MSLNPHPNAPAFPAALLDQIHDLVTATDLAGKITYVNGAACRALGKSPGELTGQHVSIFGEDPENGSTQQEIIEQTLARGEWRGEVVNHGPNGAPMVLDCRTRLLYDANGKPSGMVGISADITEIRQREKELGRLAEAVRQAAEGIVITDSTGRIEYANPAFARITGHAVEDVLGKTPKILNSGRQDRAFYENLWNTILGGNRWTGQLVNRKKDGDLYTADCSITPMKDKAGKGVQFVWITRDISDAVALEKRIAQAQQMEAVGTLAGGIAHDFNNLLFPILGISEMMKEDLPPDSPHQENVREILNAARRGRALVKQILAFSRSTEPKKMPSRIQAVIAEACRLARSTIPTSISVTQEIESACGWVMADPSQIHQVVMNLVTNAYHALETTGGRIDVSLREETVVDPKALSLSLPKGKYAVIRVSDNGPGIAPELMDRVFEPYFTTKALGKGTGLGLWVVHGIARDHGGGIHVASPGPSGQGCTVSLYLPVLQRLEATEATEPADPLETGSERILLVDDEPPIARLEKMMLERLGYHVTEHTRSTAALEAFRAAPAAFDLVITDMTMPEMTGDRLAEAIRKIRPDVPVIICTGFSEKLEQADGQDIGVQGILMKPVVKRDLARTVRRALDKRNANDPTE